MLKKISAFLLTFVMLASVCASGAPIEDIALCSDPEAVEFIVDFGIMPLKNGEFNPDSEVTRAEYVDSVLRLLGIEVTSHSRTYNTNVYDVTEYMDYGESVLFALDMGLVNGYGDGTFEPQANISLADAVVILMRALGYEPVAIASGGYPYGYLTYASSLDILGSEPTDTVLTREMCAVILYRAMDAEILAPVAFGENTASYRADENNTVLNFYHSVEEVTSLVTTQQYQMPGSSEYKKGYVILDDGTLIYTSSADDLTGQVWDIRFRNLSNGDRELVSYVLPDDSDSVTIDASDCEFADGTYTFGNNKKAHIGALTRFFYNGAELDKYDTSLLLPSIGSVTLSNKKDGYYQIAKITSYTDYVVQSVDVANQKIYSDGKSFSFEGLNYVSFLPDGLAYDLEALTEDTVISVAESAGKTNARILVSKNTAAGTLQSKGSENGCTVCTVGNESYTVSPVISDEFYADINPGDEITLYIDALGYVAGYERGISRKFEFAYLIDAAPNSDKMADNLMLKLFTQSEGVKILCTASKLEVDGEKNVSHEKALAALSNSQLILYAKNGKDCVSVIDTAYTDSSAFGKCETENSLYKYYESTSSEWHSSSSTFNGYAIRTDDTKFFIVPSDPKNASVKDFSTEISLTNETNYSVEAFKTNKEAFVAEAIVVHETDADSASYSHSTRPIMINKVTLRLNGDEEQATFITGYHVGEEKHFELRDDCKTSDGCDLSELEGGDIIRALIDSKNRIYQLEMIWDRSDENGYMKSSNPTNALYNYYHRFMYAKVHSVSGDYFRISFDENPGETPDSEMQAFRNSKVGAFYLYGENRDGTWFTKASSKDLIPWENNPENCSMVLIRQYYGAPNEVVIFNEN